MGRAAALAAALLAPCAGEAGDPAAGRTKAAACAACHGPDGIAKMPDAPHLAGQPERYLAAQLEAYRSRKRVHEAMNLVAKGLGDEDIQDLAAWFSSVRVRAEEPPTPSTPAP